MVYKLESFMIASPWNNYTAAGHCHRIQISQNTRVKEIVTEPENFPLYAYDAKSFDEVHPRLDEKLVLSSFLLGSNTYICMPCYFHTLILFCLLWPIFRCCWSGHKTIRYYHTKAGDQSRIE
jgi:hypothetical protein